MRESKAEVWKDGGNIKKRKKEEVIDLDDSDVSVPRQATWRSQSGLRKCTIG